MFECVCVWVGVWASVSVGFFGLCTRVGVWVCGCVGVCVDSVRVCV
jgi:hypothetical protein